MNNYFETQRVHWHNFSPENIIFKSNNITKKLMPEANVMSYSTKTNRDDQMATKSGATTTINKWGHSVYANNCHVAVHVKLIDVKKDFVGANIDFVDLREKKDSLGGHWGGLNVLVYIQPHHDKYQWQNTGNGVNSNWQRVKSNPQSLPDEEGYKIAYGGQGDSNPMDWVELREIGEVAEAVRQFLINRVMPFKRGEFAEKDLTLVGQPAMLV